MPEHSRLSDLAGISSSDDDFSAFWPLNIVLILLGVAILSIAFYFLDPQDQRLTHNPWSYAVATPIVLLILSALLSSVVSRLVEKSMQLAFLLSILIHLILLVYAVNVVIFSRMWPDVLESLASQRAQLQRETQRANQYVRQSITTQNGQRPDYMRYVPTQHQPTEVQQSESPALQLARAERTDLVSPTPEVQRTATPHLLERPTPVTSTPTASPQAASLSRSDLQQQSQSRSAADMLESLPQESPTPQPLRPTESLSRSRNHRSVDLQQSFTAPSIADRQPPRSLQRADFQPQRPSQQANSAMARSNSRNVQTTPLGSRLADVPNVQLPRMPAPSQLAPSQAAASMANRVNRNRSSSSASSLATPTLPNPTPMISQPSPTLTRNSRQESQWRVPTPSTGDTRAVIARDTAGGRSGPAAAISMPVQGVPSLASPISSDNELRSAPSSAVARRGGPRRSTAQLPNLGAPQSPRWDGTPSLSGGVSGTSPSQLARSAASGDAASNDVAGLTGAGRTIERSALGMLGQQGPLSLPSASNVQDGQQAADLADGSASGENSRQSNNLESGSSQIGRSSSRTAGIALAGATEASPAAGPSGGPRLALPSAMSRATDGNQSGLAPASRNAQQGSGLSRSTGNATAPVSGEIAVPDVQLAGGRSETGGLQANEPNGRGTPSASRGSLSSPIPLDIDATAGQGGISPTLDQVGSLLPRRSVEPTNLASPAIDSQRFSRQNVGGPLAAGQRVTVPKPAFQQRLERLQDRNPQDDTSAEPATELAIERGLAFLAKHQRPDGSWRLQDFDTEVLMRSDTAATGLALLAFQGAGYTHQQFKYADTVSKALEFLATNQRRNGDLYIPQDPASNQNAWLYSHSIAALALCEAYGMTQDPELKPTAQKSIDFMVASQDPQRGGWRYRPGIGADTSVTGWFMMAFKSGQLAGLDVPEETFQKIETYLDASQATGDRPHLYRYNPYAADTPRQRHGLQPTAVMTSVGLLMRLYFGWQRDQQLMLDGSDYLLEHPPENGTRSSTLRDTYYWYYATQVMFHMGGERWDNWHDRLYPLLIESQVVDGENAGSWAPMSPTPDLWARYGGRLYVTTLNLLSLEVSYRHLPLYEATGHSAAD